MNHYIVCGHQTSSHNGIWQDVWANSPVHAVEVARKLQPDLESIDYIFARSSELSQSASSVTTTVKVVKIDGQPMLVEETITRQSPGA